MIKKIKILYISRTSKFTGAENILLDIVNNLNKDIFYPIVVLPDSRGLFYEKLKQLNANIFVIKMPFLRVTYNPFLWIWFFFSILIINFRFIFIFKKNMIDIVVCHTIQEAIYVFIPCKILRRKLIVCFKNILNKRWKKKIRAKFCEVFTDKIIAVSKKAAEDFTLFTSKSYQNDKMVRVIYDGIDYGKYMKSFKETNALSKYFDKNDNDFLIINIGNLTELKGQLLLLEAIATKKLSSVSFRVLLIGEIYHKSDLAYKEKLINFIDRNNLKEKVFLLGYQKDIRNFVNSSDVLIHCPVIDDALPRVILEAFCFKKVVIATRVGGIPEMVIDNKNGFLCKVDKNDLASKIFYVYKNIKKLSLVKNMAINTAKEDFSLKNQMVEVEKVYREVLEN